jgi:hypothetical protein
MTKPDPSCQCKSWNSTARRAPAHSAHEDQVLRQGGVRLVVTRGAVVEKSRDGESKLVFRAEDVGTDKWIVPGACVLSHCTPLTLPSVSFSWVFGRGRGVVFLCFYSLMYCIADWTYMALLITAMFRMSLIEQLDLMRDSEAFGSLASAHPRSRKNFQPWRASEPRRLYVHPQGSRQTRS